jgi:siderophore synthetase component
MASLSDRIIAMLEKPEGSKAIASLIDEAKGERDRQENAAAKLDNLALNPRTSTRDAEKARKDREEVLFQVQRLEASIAELQALLETVKEAERAASDAGFYEEVKAETLTLAKDLEEQYQECAEKIRGIISRLDANAAKVRNANAVSPKGAEWLASAEELACGRPNHPSNSSRLPLSVKLPALKINGPSIWPEPQPRVVVALPKVG